MALALNFTITRDSDCKGFTFTETTGNVSDITTGWNVSHAITAVDDSNEKFTVSGNAVNDLLDSSDAFVTNAKSDGTTGGTNDIDPLVFTVNGLLEYDGTDTLITQDGNLSTEASPTGNIIVGSNETIADVSTATLVVENMTTGTEYDAVTITPNTVSGTETAVTATTLLGADGLFPDGRYCFTYTVTMTDTTVYTKEVRKLWLCESNCELLKIAEDIITSTQCDCTENLIEDFNEATSIVQAIEMAALATNSTAVDNLITNLKDFISNINCKDC